MKLFCIDPGTTRSAFVLYDNDTREIRDFGLRDNCDLIRELAQGDRLVIEMIKSYGNVMGDSVLHTCVWIGRFIQEWSRIKPRPFDLTPRKTVVTSLCGTPRAKDSNVRQALIDRIGPTGTKKEPGPTYGFKKDMWAALAIAATWQDIFDDILR